LKCAFIQIIFVHILDLNCASFQIIFLFIFSTCAFFPKFILFYFFQKVVAELSASLELQKQAGLVSASKLLDLRRVEIKKFVFLAEDTIPVIVMSFGTQEILLFKDRKTGEIKLGKEDAIDSPFYAVAFTKEAFLSQPQTAEAEAEAEGSERKAEGDSEGESSGASGQKKVDAKKKDGSSVTGGWKVITWSRSQL
jgi:hypothetical protein